MTRPIKFRAWVTQWDESFMATQGEPDLETLQSFMFHYGDQYHLMQFTGCYDMHGREIFEHMEIDNNFKVCFKNGCYVLKNISSGDIIPLYNYLKDANGQVEITKEYTEI